MKDGRLQHPTYQQHAGYPDRYDWDRFHSRSFWDHYQHAEEFDPVRKAMKAKSVKLLNRQVEEKVLAERGSDLLEPAFSGLRMTRESLEKMVLVSDSVNRLLGYESEIRADLAGRLDDEETGPLVTDVHVVYHQKISPSSVYGPDGKDIFLEEMAKEYGQQVLGIGHSHGPHRAFHSSTDFQMLKQAVEKRALRRTIQVGYGDHRFPVTIKYLPSLIVTARTDTGGRKGREKDYDVTIALKVPVFSKRGKLEERLAYNRSVPLRLEDRYEGIYLRPDLVRAQVLDRTEIADGEGTYVPLKHHLFPWREGLDSYLAPLSLEPDFRKRVQERKDLIHGSLEEMLRRKRSRLSLKDAPSGNVSSPEPDQQGLDDRPGGSAASSPGFFRRLKDRFHDWYMGKRPTKWDDQTRDNLRGILRRMSER